MTITHLRSLRKLAAGATLAFAIVAALSFAHDPSMARALNAPKTATSQNANLGDALPGTLGSGIAPVLW